MVSTVSVDVPEFTMDAGLNFAVVFLGTPPTDRLTVLMNPGPAVTLTVNVATPPRAIVLDAGVAAIEKSPVTTSVTVVV